jgi:hypothetical protein
MSLRGVVSKYQTGLYPTTRATGALIGGLWVDGSPVTFNLGASIQDIDGATLRDLPEGQSAQDSIVIFTTTELRIRTATTAPDVITYNGAQFRVTAVASFGIISGGHYRAFAEKVTVP